MEPSRVQHVTKASSDELLRKFAGDDSDSDCNSSKPTWTKSRRRSEKKRGGDNEERSPFKEDGNGSSFRVVEKRSLLSPPPHHQRGPRSMALIRRLGISSSRSHRHVKSSRNKSVLGALEKTWSKAVRGASKVFMERHYNRHRLLINDMV